MHRSLCPGENEPCVAVRGWRQIVYDLQWIPRMVDLDIIGYNGLSSDLDKPMCKPIRISGFGDVAIDGTYCLQYESSIGLHYF